MRKMIAFALVLAAPLVAASTALAHHSFAAEFDVAAPITLKGTVSKVEWSNPHAWIFVDVKDSAGKTVTWAVETGGPNALFRRGWTKNSLKIGDEVTINGWKAKDASSTANARDVTLPNGKRLGAASEAPQ